MSKEVKIYTVVAFVSAIMVIMSGLSDYTFSHMLGWLIALLEALMIIDKTHE